MQSWSQEALPPVAEIGRFQRMEEGACGGWLHVEEGNMLPESLWPLAVSLMRKL